jgi:hypothetical protein
MGKAFRGEAAVNLPQASNNAGHGNLRLARRVHIFRSFIRYSRYKFPAGWITHYLREPDDIVSFQPMAEKISCNVRVICMAMGIK